MNIGFGYLLLFGILTAPLIFWLWHLTAKSMSKDIYEDEFGKCQEKADFNCYL